MKKIVLLGLLALLFIVLPAAAQSDELAGTWIAFFGSDFSFMRFSPDGEMLSVIDTLGDHYTEYFGKIQIEDHTIFFSPSEEGTEEISYSVENGKLYLDWFGDRIYTRIDDRYFPEKPEDSPYIGENRQKNVTVFNGFKSYTSGWHNSLARVPSSMEID